MKVLLILLALVPLCANAQIEDNSFLLEEAYNQEWGVYQFIQQYQTYNNSNNFTYAFTNEIPITDKTHQFSYGFGYERYDGVEHGSITDTTLSYRWQPVNRDGILIAERFGLVVPTGSVEKGTSAGVYGFEFVQAATITMAPQWMNHWNFGFKVLPAAKTAGVDKRRTLTTFKAGTSLIYFLSDHFNLMLEGLLESGQGIDEDGNKIVETSFTINPGFRFDWNLDWKDTQIVPGVSFPTELINGPTQQAVLVYLSIEPKFY
ncbi:hypothetical protein ACJVC5_03740 [Peredibacter sp. HCB2-198]|uniref:hypothetical protein n=1 Tax=Peredibacter sp. HCB2-198 TaxID=3383025 RepID=UPI0038B4C281